MTEPPSGNPLFVQSFAKGLEVLRAFNEQRVAMNLPEMAAATGMTKSAAQRFAFTLEALGYLEKNDDKRYMLTPRVLELGYRYLLVDHFVARASPYLLELCLQTGESVNISEPSGTDMVYVGRFPSRQEVPVYMPVGRRLPMYCTSAGRAYLAALGDDEVRELLGRSDRRRYTPTTVTDIEDLMDRVRQARADGYSIADGEYYRGDLGIGTAVRDASGRTVAAVNISAPSSRWTLERMAGELAPLLIAACRRISGASPDTLDYQPFHLGLTERPAT